MKINSKKLSNDYAFINFKLWNHLNILDESDSIVKYKFLKFRLNTINYVCAHKYVQKLIWNYICTYVCIERNLTKSMLYDISVVCIDEIIVLAYLSIFSYSFKLFIGFFGGGNKTNKEEKQ